VRVTAALSWWNERTADLVDCIRGMANVADRVVALDGAYHRYPGATARSSNAEVDAIRETAILTGLDCIILQPQRSWHGEIEKRSALFAIAATGSDWVVVVDTDHIIHADRKKVRRELEGTTADVLEVILRTPSAPGKSVEETAATNWHASQAVEKSRCPLILRALPGLAVEQRHWWYSAYKDGVKVWLGGGDGSGPEATHAPMDADYEVEHRCLLRSEEQMLASRAWYNDRVIVVERTGQEDSVPGLPDPAYDYVTVPY
jgi:hypothetical protein